MNVTVIGAGLAGSECAWQLAQRGIQVELHEMKPEKMTPAHTTEYFAELCCSNSLRGAGLENAVGLLKEELRRLDSLILQCADATRVASAHCRIKLSSRRSSSFKRPTAFSRPAPRRELEQHSSAKYSVVWAGVIFSGFIS